MRYLSLREEEFKAVPAGAEQPDPGERDGPDF